MRAVKSIGKSLNKRNVTLNSNMPELGPATYDAWYHTPRGAWIGGAEFALLVKRLRPARGATLLDVGCGTGYFTRRFVETGLHVTGIDSDAAMLTYAATRSSDIAYVQGSALRLPFADRAFDYVCAITSLCFIDTPAQAAEEMWRVSRHALVLGLLNRHSLLHRVKHEQGGYKGARWDSAKEARRWLQPLGPVVDIDIRSAIFLPSGNPFARTVERCLPNGLPFGGFLAVTVQRGM